MPDADRDPRVDPRPGDKLRLSDVVYEVTSVNGVSVDCLATRLIFARLEGWPDHMASARVVARGGEVGG